MFDIKEFTSAIKQISEEKGISESSVLETIEAAIAAAYKRDYGKKGQVVRAKLDPETGKLNISQVHYVVEGVDADEFITGELPRSAAEIDEQLSRRDRSQEGQDSTDGNVGTGAIKFNPEKHILLEEAKKVNKKIKVGDELVTELETHTEFGRIAAQTAKQVVIQRLREAE